MLRLDCTIGKKKPPVDSAGPMDGPLINRSNAADYPPPSLNGYRTPASRADPGCPPAVWFRQMTGTDWASTDPPCDSKLYERPSQDGQRGLQGEGEGAPRQA